jgi:hypothetical protein
MCIIKDVPSESMRDADVVQLVERQLPKLNVAGSSPVVRSNVMGYTEYRMVRSLVAFA